jgi:hypothetical protein
MPDVSTPLLILNGVFLALLPIAFLLYRSARKLARREAAAQTVMAPTALPQGSARTPTVSEPIETASSALPTSSAASPSAGLTRVEPPTPGLALDTRGVVSRAVADAGPDALATPAHLPAERTSDAVQLVVETVAADQPWIVTRFVHELTADAFAVTLSANRETVLGRASSTIRVTQLSGDGPAGPCQTLVSTGRADAETALSALLRALLLLGYRIRWTIDTEVMLATPNGEVARVHLVPAPAIDLPDAGTPRPALLPHERPIG